MKKRNGLLLVACMGIVTALLAGCGGSASSSASKSSFESGVNTSVAIEAEHEPITLTIAAAASLEYSFKDELIPIFESQYPWITVEGTYDSSGKLQTQIEEGLQADIFMSAAPKQMNALIDKDLVEKESVVDLLENQIVLIVPATGTSKIVSFEEVVDVEHLALGDPESVPVGQYAQEVLTNLGLWDQVKDTASYATNVTEVLNWVAEGSADAGIVYATDATTTDKVKVVATAPDGSLAQKVIYPVGIVSTTQHQTEAELFMEFLQTSQALSIFETYGFISNVSVS